MDLTARYRLASFAALRREQFGGLVYRYDNRRLYFLHSPDLVTFVGTLDGATPLGEGLDAFLADRTLPAATRAPFVKALEQLNRLGLLTEVAVDAVECRP